MVKNLIIFIAGGIVGSVMAYLYTKEKMEERTRIEIESVKKKFDVENKKTQNKEVQKEYEELASVYSGNDDNHTEQFVYISPEEFYDNPKDYDQVSLMYFEGDQILADNEFNVIENVEKIIGNGLEHFDEFENDLAYVQNNELKIQYEIQREIREWKDMIGG